MIHLLDSVILIDHFNGLEKATSFINRVHSRSAISVITRAEVLVGFEREAERDLALALLDSFTHLSLDHFYCRSCG